MERETKSKSDLFQKCLAASFALHVGLLIGGQLFRHPAEPPPIEVDLTEVSGILGTGPRKLGPPKKLVPDAKGLPKPAEDKTPPQTVTAPQPKDWVMSGATTKIVEKLPEPAATPGGTETGAGTAAKPGGFGVGADDGVPNGTGDGGAPLKKWPVLLNRDELLAILRRFYPERERRASREGAVRVYLHISVEGRVEPVDVAVSGGQAFDIAAREVGRRMRFSPGIGLNGQPVPVKLPQDIIFRLED